MKTIVVLLILAVAAWGGWRHFTAGVTDAAAPMSVTTSPAPVGPRNAPPEPGPAYTCDGRTHCSQMRSCEEATYFIQHCPDTKMDGNGDGVPCERQWCG